MNQLTKQTTLEPCGVCKFHWNMIVMPGDTHNRNCPHFDDLEKGCACHGCGQRYKIDVQIADDLWSRIKPEGKVDSAGLLCGRCIFSRIEALSEFDNLVLTRVSAASTAPVVDGISWTALLACLERLRSKTRNPEAEWYHGWNAAIQCLINDINARSRPAAASPAAPADTRLWGELRLDESGEAHFICHTKDEDFATTRSAFEKFIALLQGQIANERECPFYAPAAPQEDAEPLTFKTTKQAMEYAQRHGIPSVVPVTVPISSQPARDAAAVRDDQREMDARVADSFRHGWNPSNTFRQVAETIAAAIRASKGE